MKTWIVGAALLFLGTFGFAQTARKPCDELKADIAKKLEAKNVTAYTLEIVDKGKEGDGKVVGSCDGGTKSIVYSKTAPSSDAPADAKKPQ